MTNPLYIDLALRAKAAEENLQPGERIELIADINADNLGPYQLYSLFEMTEAGSFKLISERLQKCSSPTS